MVLTPVYKMIVYAPRSVDPTETTPLTPAAGAPHSDPFVVTSIQGIAGAKPYLDIPTGRGSTIDPLNKKTNTSSLSARILDARVTAGGGNAARWVSAFTGDGSGGDALLGRLVGYFESFNGGATWTPYFTGRVSGPTLSGLQWVELPLKGLEDDLDLDVFVGAPHTSVTYAALAQIAPLGLLHPVRPDGTGYAGFPRVAPIRATVQALETAGTRRVFSLVVDQSDADQARLTMTQALVAAGQSAQQRLGISQSVDPGVIVSRPPRVMVAAAADTHVDADYSAFDLVWIDVQEVGGIFSAPNPLAPVKFASAPLSAVAPVATTLGYLMASSTGRAGDGTTGAGTPITVGASVDLYIDDPLGKPSATTPLLIDDVSVVTYLSDLCAGKFGRLAADGSVLRAIPFNANGVTATGRIPWRNQVSKASTLVKELEAVCLANNLAYYTDGSGAITLVDLRRTSVTAPAWALVDDDLVAGTNSVNRTPDRGSAVTALLGMFYPEDLLSASDLPTPHRTHASLSDVPDVPTIALAELQSVEVLVPQIGPRSGDFKSNVLKVDAPGWRCRMAPQTVGNASSLTSGLVDQERIGTISASGASLLPRSVAIRQQFVAYSDEIAGPFGLGPAYIDVICRRGSANVALVKPGTYGSLTLSALPDPATNERGGPRLALCVSRTDAAGKTTFRFLDAGANAVALPPTFGVPTNASGTTTQAVALPVTLNALGEPVRVAYAATDPSVGAAPPESDGAWTVVTDLVRSTSIITIANLLGGQRIWLRARTVPGAGKGFKLPSAWAFPATTHIDLAGIGAPSALSVTGPSVDQLTLAWTNGDPTKGIEVFLALGATVTPSDATRLTRPLPPGTIKLPLPPLAASTQYTIGMRALDAYGGVSSLTTLTFVSTAIVAILSAPIDARGFSGRQDARYGFPQADGVYGLAVAATAFPGFVSFQEAIETAAGSGLYGATTTVARVPAVQGEWTLIERVAPNDGLRRQLSARSERDQTNPSDWTDPVTVLPWSAQHLEQYAVVVQRTSILRITDTESADGTTADLTAIVGDLVDHVQLYSRTVSIDELADVYDFSDAAVLPFSIAVLRPDSALTVAASLPQPARGFRVAARLVPFSLSPAGAYQEGESVPFTVNAAPPALNAIIHATRAGASASLSIDVAFGVSDGPVAIDVIETVLGVETTIFSSALAAPGTLDPAIFAALADRPIPSGAESVSWRAVITDVSGQAWTFGPVTALPPLVSAAISTSEDTVAKTGTVTAVLADDGGYLNRIAGDELDPSKVGAITWHVTRLGVTTVFVSTSAPASGTSGIYTFVAALDPLHSITVRGFRHYVDGSTDSLGAWTFDSDKIADVVSLTAANADTSAVITANFDTDVAIGANCARYSLDAGVTWTLLAVSGSPSIAQATIARTSVKQTVLVEGLNAVDGTTWGNARSVEIDAYVSESPSLTAGPYLALTSSTGQIPWSCPKGVVTLSLDGGAPTTPSASPIAITLDGSTHSYNFVATNGGVSDSRPVFVPALPASGGSSGSFSSLTNALHDATANTIDFGGAWSGPAVAFNVWVRDFGRYGDQVYHLFTTTGVSPTLPFLYTAGEDITTNHGDPTVIIGFYFETVSGSTIGVRSVPVETTYNHV